MYGNRKRKTVDVSSRVGKKMKPMPRRQYLRPTTEKKWLDTAATSSAVSNTGTIVSNSINLLTAGTGESQIIGRKVVVKAIQLQGDVSVPSQSDATLGNLGPDGYMDIYIVLDKQANGAAATFGNLFESADVRGFKNLENSQRFRVLKAIRVKYDREVNHDGTNYFQGQAIVPFDDVYLNVDIPLEFGATPSGVITDVRSNNVFIAAVRTAGSASTLNWRARIRYVDA